MFVCPIIVCGNCSMLKIGRCWRASFQSIEPCKSVGCSERTQFISFRPYVIHFQCCDRFGSWIVEKQKISDYPNIIQFDTCLFKSVLWCTLPARCGCGGDGGHFKWHSGFKSKGLTDGQYIQSHPCYPNI